MGVSAVQFRLNFDKNLDVGEEFDHIRAVVENSVPLALTAKEMEKASYDEELNMVKGYVSSGNWSQCKASVSHLHVKDVQCLYRELLLHGTTIVIPRTLRN